MNKNKCEMFLIPKWPNYFFLFCPLLDFHKTISTLWKKNQEHLEDGRRKRTLWERGKHHRSELSFFCFVLLVGLEEFNWGINWNQRIKPGVRLWMPVFIFSCMDTQRLVIIRSLPSVRSKDVTVTFEEQFRVQERFFPYPILFYSWPWS